MKTPEQYEAIHRGEYDGQPKQPRLYELGDQVQNIECMWQGRVTGFDVQDGVEMLVCHHVCGGKIEEDDKRWFDPRDMRLVQPAQPPIKTRKYLIFAGHHAAIIDMPLGVSSNGYGKLQDWFAKTTRGDSYASMRSLDEHERVGEVYYHWELAGPDGASYELFQLPDISAETVQKAEDHIRRTQDVVRLTIRRFKHLHDIQSELASIIE